MKFTDKQLARVKRDLGGFRSWATDSEVLALLNRLECAEIVADLHGDCCCLECKACLKWEASKGVKEGL